MTILAWTAAPVIVIGALLIFLMVGGYGLTLLAKGQARLIMQVILAIVGLALAMLIATR